MITVGSVVAGRYRLDELISHGGMASVFAAHDEVLDRRVAVKVTREASAVDQRRFSREARMLAGLAHPNLIAVFDAGQQDGELFLVLELIDGPTLATQLAEGPLHEPDVHRIGQELAAALAYVHRQGVVHRDVKPSNVMFDGHGTTRLGDFGIARSPDSTALTATATTVGTAAYMAPEQLEGSEPTAKVDIYSLGLALLECLTGVRAFPGPAHEAALARLVRNPEIPADLPPPWPSLLRSMTEREPTKRPDAEEVRGRIGPVEGDAAPTVPLTATATASLPSAQRPQAPAILGPGRRWRRGAVWALCAILTVIAGVAAVAMLGRDGGDPPIAPTTTAAPAVAPTTAATTVPPSTAPPIDCAALEAERDELEERKREINEEFHDDRETRERIKDEVEARQREVDALLRENCR